MWRGLDHVPICPLPDFFCAYNSPIPHLPFPIKQDQWSYSPFKNILRSMGRNILCEEVGLYWSHSTRVSWGNGHSPDGDKKGSWSGATQSWKFNYNLQKWKHLLPHSLQHQSLFTTWKCIHLLSHIGFWVLYRALLRPLVLLKILWVTVTMKLNPIEMMQDGSSLIEFWPQDTTYTFRLLCV